MLNVSPMKPDDVAVRSHDVTVCLERTTIPDFELITMLGRATRLALHLRGVQAVPYTTIRDVAIYLLDFPSASDVKSTLFFLAEAEFVKLDVEGQTIKSVIPDIPYFAALFSQLGDLASLEKFSEPEQLTLMLMHRLADSPMLLDHVHQLGADKNLVKRVIQDGTNGSFLLHKRARGRSILLSPTYFPENQDAYADLVASAGAERVKKIIELLRINQGWPLKKIQSDKQIAGIPLDDKDILTLQMLAGEGFLPPPAIETSHSGLNYFLFGPRPGEIRLPPTKRQIYESAMALVAAIRQGQLLPDQYAIHSPIALLSALRDRGHIASNTEAVEQYKQVAALRVGRLSEDKPGWARFELIQRPENYEAVDMAIQMLGGNKQSVAPREDIILALRGGDKYVESIIGHKRLIQNSTIMPDPETKTILDTFLLRGH